MLSSRVTVEDTTLMHISKLWQKMKPGRGLLAAVRKPVALLPIPIAD
jgi:hypothetical protein